MQSTRSYAVTESTWEQEVVKSDKLVATFFYSPTCPHCKALMPAFDSLSVEYSDRIKFVKLNAEEYRTVAEGYGVMGVPTIKFFCSGRPVSDIVGNLPKEDLKALLDRMLSIHKKCLATSTPIYYI